MLRPRRAVPMVMLAAGAMAVAACSGGDAPPLEPDGTPWDGAFVYGISAPPQTFDPFLARDRASLTVARQVYDGLVDVDLQRGSLTPGLASGWDGTDQAREWTFTVRDDMRFHDGSAVDGEVVCANVQRWKDAEPGTSPLWDATLGRQVKTETGTDDLLASCEPDGQSVTIRLHETSGLFPAVLAHPTFGIQQLTDESVPDEQEGSGDEPEEPSSASVPPAASPTAGADDAEPAPPHRPGTGSFVLTLMDEDSGAVQFERNDDAPEDRRARAETLTLLPQPDDSGRLESLHEGELEAYDLVAPQDWAALDGDATRQTRPAATLALGVRMAAGSPLRSTPARQAVSAAVDRQALVDQLPPGAEPANQVSPPGDLTHVRGLPDPEMDAAGAQALLERVGEGTTQVRLWRPDAPDLAAPDPAGAAEAVARDLEAAGFEVDVVTGADADPQNAQASDPADLFLMSVPSGWWPVGGTLHALFGSPDTGFALDDTAWGPQVMQDLAAADGIPEEGARREAYQGIARQLAEDRMPLIPLAWTPSAIALGDNTEGLSPHPLGMERLTWARIE